MSADRVRAYIALGANLGDSAATLKTVLDELRQTPGIAAVTASRFYRTAPVEATGPDFVNAPRRWTPRWRRWNCWTCCRPWNCATAAPLQERAAHAGPGHAAPRRPVPRRPAPGPAPSPHAPAPSCCVRCWTWPHPARRRPPGRRLAGRHPRPAHLPAVKAPRDNRLPIPTSARHHARPHTGSSNRGRTVPARPVRSGALLKREARSAGAPI